jgi:hypothetical protein
VPDKISSGKGMKSIVIQLGFITAALLAAVVHSKEMPEPILVYQQYYTESTAGVYQQADWLFVVAEQEKLASKQPAIYYEGKTMLQTQVLLKKYVLQHAQLKALKQHGFTGRLAVDLDELVASGDFYDFRLDAIQVKILKNNADKKRHRRVTAVKANELSSAKASLLKHVDINILISQLLKQAAQKSNKDLLARYYFDLGLLREAYFYKWQQLSQNYYLVNYPALDKTPFQSRLLLRKVLNTSAENYDLDWLKKLPANAELFAQVKSEISGLDRIGQSLLDFLLMPALAPDKQKQQFDKLRKTLDMMTPNATIQLELDFLQASQERFGQDKDLAYLLGRVFAQQGFLILDASYSADSNLHFTQAKALFDKGRSIDKVANLLQQSILESPRHTASWIYYGSVLKYQKQYTQALAAFQQASLLDHTDTENQANIADIYMQMKQPNLARPYLYYLQQQPIKNLSTYTQKVLSQLIQIKD